MNTGSHPNRPAGQEWKDTLSIIANLPRTVADAIAGVLLNTK